MRPLPHERAQELALALAVHRVHQLAHEDRCGVARSDVHFGRPVEESVGELADRVREGGREEERLAPLRQQRKDPPDVVDEAHVEHPIGLVEDEDLDPREVDRVLAGVVEEATRRRDDDLGAGAEGARLRAEADAAVDGHRADRPAGAVDPDALLDLEGKLAGRDQHERAHGTARRGAAIVGAGRLAVEALEHGEDERGRLAGARLGARQQVAAGEDERDGRGLDGSGLGVALVRDRAKELGRQPELIKGHANAPGGALPHDAGPGQGAEVNRDRRRENRGADRSAHRTREKTSLREIAGWRSMVLGTRPRRRARRQPSAATGSRSMVRTWRLRPASVRTVAAGTTDPPIFSITATSPA